jgi:hypothetical protein
MVKIIKRKKDRTSGQKIANMTKKYDMIQATAEARTRSNSS